MSKKSKWIIAFCSAVVVAAAVLVPVLLLSNQRSDEVPRKQKLLDETFTTMGLEATVKKYDFESGTKDDWGTLHVTVEYYNSTNNVIDLSDYDPIGDLVFREGNHFGVVDYASLSKEKNETIWNPYERKTISYAFTAPNNSVDYLGNGIKGAKDLYFELWLWDYNFMVTYAIKL